MTFENAKLQNQNDLEALQIKRIHCMSECRTREKTQHTAHLDTVYFKAGRKVFSFNK